MDCTLIKERLLKFIGDQEEKEKTDGIKLRIAKTYSLEVDKGTGFPCQFRIRSVTYKFLKTFIEHFANGDNSIPGLSDRTGSESDLIAGHYEGGFKIWECTEDLMRWLAAEGEKVISELTSSLGRPLRVLDLGCGGGLLGISCFTLFPNMISTVHFQDYNQSVLKYFTASNLILNNCDQKDYKLIAGDWEDIAVSLNAQYDLILTSETIYCPTYYTKLLNILQRALQYPNGLVFLAAKSHYFGVGGSTSTWIDFVNSHQDIENNEKSLECSPFKVIDASVKREILKLAFKSS